jgi:hypothetical protein
MSGPMPLEADLVGVIFHLDRVPGEVRDEVVRTLSVNRQLVVGSVATVVAEIDDNRRRR